MENIEQQVDAMNLEGQPAKSQEAPQTHPDDITFEYVNSLELPTDRFLCKLSDNTPKFKFAGFKIRDMMSKITLVEVPDDGDDAKLNDDDDPSERVIKYHLGPDFLMLSQVGLTLNFSIGDTPIKKLQMVERHYFRGEVIRSYSFTFGFVIPGSTNSWEFIYDLPELTDEKRNEIIEAPWEVKSDSYFFADDKLIIHNRAIYNYQPLY